MATQPPQIEINASALPKPSGVGGGPRTVGRPLSASSRVSQPQWMNTSIATGFGFVPRRTVGDQWDRPNTLSIERLLVLAHLDPLRTLTYLPEVFPEMGKAVWNVLRLGCGKDAVRMKAMARSADGKNVQEAPDGTEAVKVLFDSLPPEIGGLTGALSKNLLMLMFSGMCAVEDVPGPRNTGIASMWPIDTLTCRFRRDKTTKLVGLWQHQNVVDYGKNEVYSGFVRLPEDRVFWSSVDGFPDDPYGRAPYASALMPILEMVAFMKDLLLAWHRVGTPKWDIGFDYEMWARIAREQYGLSDKKEIQDFIEEEFNNAVNLFSSLNADDAFFHDIASKVGVNGSGGHWPNVKELFEILRYRCILALKEMPAMMNVVDGSGDVWAGVDWQVYSRGLSNLVEKAAGPLVASANLHLRLLGMPYVVEAAFEPIRANQRMVDAQAEQLEIQNEAAKRDQGWITNDEAAMAITGSAAVTEPDKEMLGVLPKPTNADGKPPQGPSKGT